MNYENKSYKNIVSGDYIREDYIIIMDNNHQFTFINKETEDAITLDADKIKYNFIHDICFDSYVVYPDCVYNDKDCQEYEVWETDFIDFYIVRWDNKVELIKKFYDKVNRYYIEPLIHLPQDSMKLDLFKALWKEALTIEFSRIEKPLLTIKLTWMYTDKNYNMCPYIKFTDGLEIANINSKTPIYHYWIDRVNRTVENKLKLYTEKREV